MSCIAITPANLCKTVLEVPLRLLEIRFPQVASTSAIAPCGGIRRNYCWKKRLNHILI
jgi:hypothetical protein